MNIIADINVQDARWNASIEGLEKYVDSIVFHTLGHVPFFQERVFEEIEVSLVFADDVMITGLNLGYREKDQPTNVLSFPQVDWDAPDLRLPVIALGDEIFALETIEREAREQDKSFQDHCTHLIVHGLLHLCGYDHMKKTEAEAMEALEIEILAELSINNPYQS